MSWDYLWGRGFGFELSPNLGLRDYALLLQATSNITLIIHNGRNRYSIPSVAILWTTYIMSFGSRSYELGRTEKPPQMLSLPVICPKTRRSIFPQPDKKKRHHEISSSCRYTVGPTPLCGVEGDQGFLYSSGDQRPDRWRLTRSSGRPQNNSIQGGTKRSIREFCTRCGSSRDTRGVGGRLSS